MPELVRSVVSRVRVYFKDRRQSPRLRVRLVFSVGIKREVSGNGSNRRAKTRRASGKPKRASSGRKRRSTFATSASRPSR